jgi:hypothetical protein
VDRHVRHGLTPSPSPSPSPSREIVTISDLDLPANSFLLTRHCSPWALPGHVHLPYSIEEYCLPLPVKPHEERNNTVLIFAKRSGASRIHVHQYYTVILDLPLVALSPTPSVVQQLCISEPATQLRLVSFPRPTSLLPFALAIVPKQPPQLTP